VAKNSSIEWTHHTFNPWRGCKKVSAGCANCYADTQAKRNRKTLAMWGSEEQGGTRVVAAEAMWQEPVKWNRQAKAEMDAWLAEHKGAPYEPPRPPSRPRIFCASFADVFEDWQGPMVNSDGHPIVKCYSCMKGGFSSVGAPSRCKCGGRLEHASMHDVRARLFQLIDATPNLDWLLLTKRPENIARMMPKRKGCERCHGSGKRVAGIYLMTCEHCGDASNLIRPNVWLGTSVENQQTADERIPHLLRVPAAVRFLSMEPLLGPVDLTNLPQPSGDVIDGLSGWTEFKVNGGARVRGVNWVIVGGESGPNARPMHPNWARSIRDQCQAAGVPFFFKQWGEYSPTDLSDPKIGCPDLKVNDPRLQVVPMRRVGKKSAGRTLDGQIWDQFPKGAACSPSA
jgi:protein gp37